MGTWGGGMGHGDRAAGRARRQNPAQARQSGTNKAVDPPIAPSPTPHAHPFPPDLQAWSRLPAACPCSASRSPIAACCCWATSRAACRRACCRSWWVSIGLWVNTLGAACWATSRALYRRPCCSWVSSEGVRARVSVGATCAHPHVPLRVQNTCWCPGAHGVLRTGCVP